MTLHDQLERSLDRYPGPDLDRLAGAARRQGARQRRRRTAATGLAAAAVVTAVATGGLLATTGGHGGTTAADAPAGTAPSGPSGPEVAATPPGIVAALEWAVSQESEGTASDFAGQGGAASVVDDAYAQLQWHTDDGAGTSVVQLNRGFRFDGDQGTCHRLTDCHLTTLADGTRLMLMTERVQAAGGTGIRRGVGLYHPDGSWVYVSASNGFDRGGDADGNPVWDVTRPEPPLTTAELRDIADQPFWGRTIPAGFEASGAHLPSYVDLDARSARDWNDATDPSPS